jgi:hypothetical protein
MLIGRRIGVVCTYRENYPIPLLLFPA